MDAPKTILEHLGIESAEEMAVDESYTIEVEGSEDLTIERVGSRRISVAHHYVQRGDLMCDPEVVCMCLPPLSKSQDCVRVPLTPQFSVSLT